MTPRIYGPASPLDGEPDGTTLACEVRDGWARTRDSPDTGEKAEAFVAGTGRASRRHHPRATDRAPGGGGIFAGSERRRSRARLRRGRGDSHLGRRGDGAPDK